MGLYNVVAPCIVAGRHYTRPAKAAVEVDDDEATPLVKAGQLEPCEPAHAEHVHVSVVVDDPAGGGKGDIEPEPQIETPPRRPGRARQ